jgi:putative iron-regulated protein
MSFGSAAIAQDKADVLNNYANIANAVYADSLTTAPTLQNSVAALIAEPSAEAL